MVHFVNWVPEGAGEGDLPAAYRTTQACLFDRIITYPLRGRQVSSEREGQHNEPVEILRRGVEVKP